MAWAPKPVTNSRSKIARRRDDDRIINMLILLYTIGRQRREAHGSHPAAMAASLATVAILHVVPLLAAGITSVERPIRSG